MHFHNLWGELPSKPTEGNAFLLASSLHVLVHGYKPSIKVHHLLLTTYAY